ncbi:hypothetical protein ACMFMG_003671 [Clarireedia jacksonii]
MTLCKFFAQGSCRHGDSCHFIHEPGKSIGQHLSLVTPTLPTTVKPKLNPAAVTYLSEGAKPPQNCHFFLQGNCNKGEGCRYIHPLATPQPVHADPILVDSPHLPSDSRATVPCRFLPRPGGCQNNSCPYLHAVDKPNAEKRGSQDLEANGEEDQEREDDFIRSFSGATVYFNEAGDILKISFPNDFSLVCITGFASETTHESIIGTLHELGFNITANCVRISKSVVSLEPKATVKVEDPLFARELISRLKTQRSALSAVQIPISSQQTNCRKVHISWHKSTRSIWVNFGSGDIANRVAQKFNEGKYKCMGSSVKSSVGRRSSTRGGRHGRPNPVAWTIVLSDVPSDVNSKDIEESIKSTHDKPRHVEPGPISYSASDAEVSVVVRSHLEKHGPLESFYLAPTNNGKRVKATALFVDEADATSACSLNNLPLDILGKGKLTVTTIQTVKIKVSTAVYIATKSEVDLTMKSWKERHLVIHVYPDAMQRFTTLKIEGSSAQDVASARKSLDLILGGMTLRAENNIIWSPLLNSNRGTYKRLKSIEKELQILIIRDKIKRQLQYYGPREKLQHTAHQVAEMLRAESSSNHDTQQQDERTSTIITGIHAVEIHPALDTTSTPEGRCPICLDDEPDTPVQTLCKHTYCLECFENYCQSAASTSKDGFRIECPGDEGNCAAMFDLAELKERLSSSAFEGVLKSSFGTYVQRHPNDLHYCPTPDCGYVYRCARASDSNAKPPAYTCPNCLEPICTYCHARHGRYTCAEYKDIESGGYEALEKLKRELNIKDCPKCKTPMEKTEGCNHMTCGGCGVHICWVCMAVFETSGRCYEHMNKQHGGIGLDHLHNFVV